RVGDGLLGRVIDGSGQALDLLGAYRGYEYRMLDAAAPLPLERVPIREPLGCGIRAIDAFLTCGRGQRVGIFGGSGVGKSTLIGMLARNTNADLTVLALVVDSLTRLAMAQREIGLAAGEPPTAKGYTPSVFTLLARLIERAGSFGSGTITGFYTVLMEGDDENDPLVDAARALLDGHVMLDRRLAAQSHYPPI